MQLLPNNFVTGNLHFLLTQIINILSYVDNFLQQHTGRIPPLGFLTSNSTAALSHMRTFNCVVMSGGNMLPDL